MIYIALEIDRPTLALVKQAIRDAAENFETMAIDADSEEGRWPDPTRLRLGNEGLHIKGQRQIEYRANASSLRALLAEQLLP